MERLPDSVDVEGPVDVEDELEVVVERRGCCVLDLPDVAHRVRVDELEPEGRAERIAREVDADDLVTESVPMPHRSGTDQSARASHNHTH